MVCFFKVSLIYFMPGSLHQNRDSGVKKHSMHRVTKFFHHGKCSTQMKHLTKLLTCKFKFQNARCSYSLFRWPGPEHMTTDKKLLGYCVPQCVHYDFDHSFWVSTMVTEWDLVCEKTWLKTLAKMLLFTGLCQI